MQSYNIQLAQQAYAKELSELKCAGNALSESQEALLFSKILVKQADHSNKHITFCRDSEMFVSKTPTGYDVVGYYIDGEGNKSPFSLTVCKVDALWYLSQRRVAADTKSCSSYIILWVLLSVGCTLMGIIMFYLISASIGI